VLDEPTSGLGPLMEQVFRRCVREARDAGQTAFLPSHILSEVEALCDRVGILRQRRLVEIGTLEAMRHLSTLTVEAVPTGTPLYGPQLSAAPPC
jgi:ABC-2 type transport system ATP-binding protein